MSTQSLAFEWTETNRQWLIETPIRIACFIVAALVIRWLLFRLIDRVTKPRVGREDGGTRLVRGLRERTSARTPKANARRTQRAKTIGSVLKSTVSVVILVWLVLTVLAELDVNIAPFIASAGIIGLAIGFGAQHLVADIVSGVFMMMEDQYGVGDIADFGEVIGEIESVGLRITTVRDMDGTLWYIRNGEIERVGNMSQDFAVARLEVPVAVDADLGRAQDVALRAAQRGARDTEIVSEVLGEPEMLGVQEVTSSHAMLRMTVTTKPGAQWGVLRHLRSEVLGDFDRESIKLPMQSWGEALAGPR
ncbi:mechanosensitive ion channel family protein [Gordonia sp. HY442]|uniref:mechanosensitive ion channel family protein n=1 Tax=Gordonia zhenghanii TaxID=2911516 RepID=UPI001F275FFA|nr:mechanosensitive ion channel family protein [Gordonia zhenghanii]MCF8607878.1 mechanosensitive ion channel family protein [Gordonia zhenghanii]